MAEARFFRAYSHFRLMAKYNDIPILTKVLTVDSPELYGSRNKQQEVEDFILSELNEVYAKLPLQSELSSDEAGRVTQGAALALKARVALFAGTWAKYHQHRSDYQQLLQQAIDAATKVIDSGEYALYEGSGEESYRYLFINAGDNSKEGIFDSRYETDIRHHSDARALYIGDGEGRLPVSWQICICVRVRDCQLRTLIPDLRDMPRSRANTRIVILV